MNTAFRGNAPEYELKDVHRRRWNGGQDKGTGLLKQADPATAADNYGGINTASNR
jgi:hypothetical protein